jgi:hypothetical protein
MTDTPQTPEKLMHEYSELSSNVRHYSSLRFAMFTVYFGLTGGIASAAFHFVEPKAHNVVEPFIVARCAGVFFTVIFFVLETIINRILTHEVAILKTLEAQLGYSELANLQGRRVFNSRNTIYALYMGVGLFWFVTIWLR